MDAQCVIYTGTTITCDTDVIVTTNDTVAEALESITDYFCNNGGGGSQFTYEIGQYVASEGGVIMHRWLSAIPNGTPTAGTTQNYIVVDLNDLSSAAQYATLNVDILNVESTFDGETNTANLIAAGAGSGITAGTAVQLCDASANAGLTDWYLPAIDELNKLYNNRWEVSQGLISAGSTEIGLNQYWSSTEDNGYSAWAFIFSDGYAYNSDKNFTYYVRAIRRFSI
jgi:hypothetical protein